MKVQVTNLTKTYSVRATRGRRTADRRLVLSAVEVEAESGTFLTVLGPSGCGKSTLLNAIAGLIEWDSGSIEVDGRPVTGPGPERAVVFQSPSLLPWRQVRGNISYGLEILGGLTRAERAERVDEVLGLVRLRGCEAQYPHELSGGMRQRVNLARALALRPAVLLMDEPFGALDAITKEHMQDELARLSGESRFTTVFITHDIEEAVYLGDRVVVMSASPGRVQRVLDIGLDRPRNRGTRNMPEFQQYVSLLREELDHSVSRRTSAVDEVDGSRDPAWTGFRSLGVS